MLCPFSVIFIKLRLDPVFIDRHSLFTIIADDNGRNASKKTQCMIVYLNPLRLLGREHPFCVNVLRIGQHCHKYNDCTEFSGQAVDHRECFPCKIHLHFFAAHSIEMQCLIVFLTPGHVSIAKLTIGIEFFFLCHAAVFIPSPKKHQSHVLPAVHLLFHFRKIGKLKA